MDALRSFGRFTGLAYNVDICNDVRTCSFRGPAGLARINFRDTCFQPSVFLEKKVFRAGARSSNTLFSCGHVSVGGLAHINKNIFVIYI